jgi:hypothetical protein
MFTGLMAAQLQAHEVSVETYGLLQFRGTEGNIAEPVVEE